MLAKYQYLFRESAFRVLRRLPSPLRTLAVNWWVQRQRSWLGALTTPGQLIFYVTNRCNARCAHCFYWREVSQGVTKELPLNCIETIAKTLVNPLATLSLTGGEPFLRDDLAQICQAFWRLNRTRKVNIVTNGFFTDRIKGTTAEILETCPVDLNVQVSLDGPPNVHDAMRKISIFEEAMETIQVLDRMSRKYRNLQVTVLTTISEQNLGALVALGSLVKRSFPDLHHGFQFIRSAALDVYQIDQDILSGLDPEAQEPLLSVGEMERALSDTAQFSDQTNTLLHSFVRVMNEGIVRMKREQKPFTKCLAGRYDAVVWPDGQVSLCEFTKPFADLSDFQFDFFRLWRSPAADEMREKTRTCFCTHTCNLLNAMQFDKKVLAEICAF